VPALGCSKWLASTSSSLTQNREHWRTIQPQRKLGTINLYAAFRALMTDPFDKADRCRSRAKELRDVAARSGERDVRAVLIAIAESLDAHARTLEQVGFRFRLFSRARMPAAAD